MWDKFKDAWHKIWLEIRPNAKWDLIKLVGSGVVFLLVVSVCFLREGSAFQIWGLIIVFTALVVAFLFIKSKPLRIAGGILAIGCLLSFVILALGFYEGNRQRSESEGAAKASAFGNTNFPVVQVDQSSNAAVNNNSGNTSVSINNNSGIAVNQSGINNKQFITLITNSPGAQKTTGFLVPHWTNNTFSTRVGIHFLKNKTIAAGSFEYMDFDLPPGETIMPLGEYVPLAITITTSGIQISAEFKGMDGKMVAELIQNEWRVNPNNYFKLNYDQYALEVVDDNNIPWLQIEYVSPNIVHLGGVFRRGLTSWLSIHPEVRNVHQSNFIVVSPGSFMILGNKDSLILNDPELGSESQNEKFVKDVREVVHPWFDYTPSKGLGVRIQSDSKATPLSVEIPSSPIAGILEGEPFHCDRAVLKISSRDLVFSEGIDSEKRVEISFGFASENDSVAETSDSGKQRIPIQNIKLFWKEGAEFKVDTLKNDFVFASEFRMLSKTKMSCKIYIESVPEQRTKILGTIEASVQ